jgi:hypothetical protein
MPVAQFRQSLQSTLSLRNLRDVTARFRKHSPIPRLHTPGVGLSTARYLAMYLIKRSARRREEG